jgi:hypothetical protein
VTDGLPCVKLSGPTNAETNCADIGLTGQPLMIPANKTDPQDAAIPFHEFANIFPMSSADQLTELARDIAAHSLLEPVVLYEGKILDGRGRYLACRQAGVEPKFEEYTGDDPLGYVLSRNLHRRHLDESQRAMVAAKIANLKVGANQHSEGLPIGRASELMNVSARSAARAKEVLKSGDPTLVAAVEAGELAVSTAAELTHAGAASPTHGADHEVEGCSGHSDDGTVTSTDAPEVDSEIGEESNEAANHSPRERYRFDKILTTGVTVIVGSASSAVLPVAIKIGATASAGSHWPDHSWPHVGDVAWLSTHHDADRWLRPQFEAAHADLQRVRFVDPNRDEFGLPVRNLFDDLQRLGGETLTGVSCVVIDYLSEYLRVGNVERSVNRLRSAVSAMKKLADKEGVAIFALCQIPGRDDGEVTKAMNEIGSWSDIQAVLRVERADKPNRGVFLPMKDGVDCGFPFQLRQYNGVPAVVWDSVFAAASAFSVEGSAR